MAEADRFTFAELEFLLSASQTWPDTRRRLGIADTAMAEGVRAAGLASLIVRNLARLDTERGVQLAPGIDASIIALDLPRTWLDLVVSRDGISLGAYAGLRASAPTLVLSLAAPGVFQLDAIESAYEPAESVADLVATLLSRPGELSVAARSAGAGSQVVVRRTAAGGLAVGAEPASTPADDASVRERIHAIVYAAINAAT